MTTAYHVAAKELSDWISENGLVPHGDRAILLIAEPPLEAFDFDVWEVDLPEGLDGVDRADAVFCRDRIPAERLRLLPEDAPAPSMGT